MFAKRNDRFVGGLTQLEFHATLSKGAFADRQPEGQPDQIGIVEFDTRAFVAVIVENFYPGGLQVGIEFGGGIIGLGCSFAAQQNQIYLVRGDSHRPDQAMFIMMRLGYAGEQAAHADAVGTHDDRFCLPVLVEECTAKGVRVTRAEFEDVAYFHTTLCPQWTSTFRAGMAFIGSGDVSDDMGLVIAGIVGIEQVITGLIGSGNQVGAGGDGIVDYHTHPHSRREVDG